ncbi:hypothetical protein ACWDR1_00520 [Streptosporangium sandarakinum]|uniref:hypothetical protein n=1 Tax=Streptosporangium sandarakinum TaxID=1260955 RepID=UPI0033B7B7FC
MIANEAKVRLGRTFAVSGTKLALAMFVGGVKGLLFFVAVRGYSTDVTAAYGTSLTVMLAVMMLGVGLNVLVVQRLARKIAGDELLPDGLEPIRSIAAAAVASTVVLLTTLVLAGLAISFTDAGGLTAAAYWSRVPTLVLIPVENVIVGLLIVLGREGVQLRTTLENLALTSLAALTLPWLKLGDMAVLVAIGVFGVAVDIFTTIRQWVRLGPVRGQLAGALVRAVPLFLSQPGTHLRTMLLAVTGASDGLIMMGSFAVVTALASGVSVEAAAVTATLISVIRTVVVPLKQYGIVAGRLAKAPGEQPGLAPGARMRLFIALVAAVMAPLGLVFIAFPQMVASVVGIGDPSQAALLVIRVAGVQLLLEPMAGFASAALKILTVPSAAMRPLLIAMFGMALPVMAALFITGHLSLIAIWVTLLGARVVFCAQVFRLYLMWKRTVSVVHAS